MKSILLGAAKAPVSKHIHIGRNKSFLGMVNQLLEKIQGGGGLKSFWIIFKGVLAIVILF